MADELTGGMAGALGMRVEAASGDEVRLSLLVGPQVLQPYGIVHGGAYCALVETAGSIGGALWFGDRGKVVGVANSTNFFRATREGLLTAVATPVHRGRTSQVWAVSITGPDGRLVASGELRLANVADEQIGA